MMPHEDSPLFLLCTTSYDEMTCLMSRLLSDFSYNGKEVHHHRLREPGVSYVDVLNAYRQKQDRIVLIFCGHGDEDALLTGKQQDCSKLKKDLEEGVFYDAAYFDSGPTTLAAVCEGAGKNLGPSFAQDGRTFLGFSDKLWLTKPVSEECTAWWKKILNGLVTKVIEDENVEEDTLNFIRSLHEEAYNYFCSEEAGLSEEALAMRMCLRRNLAGLCNY